MFFEGPKCTENCFPLYSSRVKQKVREFDTIKKQWKHENDVYVEYYQ